MQRQRGKLTPKALKEKWKSVDEKEAQNQSDGWPWNLQLPCRGCSDADKKLEEVKHPLSTFVCRDAGYQKAWAEISRGQHLLCPPCKRAAGMTMDGGIMFCDVCGNLKPKLQFSNAEKQRWTDDAEKSFTCQRCEGQMKATKCYPCLECGRHWLLSGFAGKEHIKMTDDSEAPVMTCYRCVALKENSELMLEQHKCQGCKKTLPWSAYDPILLGWIVENEKKRGF